MLQVSYIAADGITPTNESAFTLLERLGVNRTHGYKIQTKGRGTAGDAQPQRSEKKIAVGWHELAKGAWTRTGTRSLQDGGGGTAGDAQPQQGQDSANNAG